MTSRKTYYSNECRVRDAYAQRLSMFRPDERLVKKELRYATAARRVDMRTVDRLGTLREWEFKISADHRTLGQLLIYLSHARRELGFRPVRGVIAAFSVPDELRTAIEVMSLNIELVTLPSWMRYGGFVPMDTPTKQLNPIMRTEGETK